MKTKRLLALTLTMAMTMAILALTACGGNVTPPQASMTPSAAARRYSNMIWTGDEGYVIRLSEDGGIKVSSPYSDENESLFFTGIAKFTDITQFCFLDDEYFIGLKSDGTVFSYAGDDDDRSNSVKLKEELASWKDIIDICAVDKYLCVAGLTKDGNILISNGINDYLAENPEDEAALNLLAASEWGAAIDIESTDNMDGLIAIMRDGTIRIGGRYHNIIDLHDGTKFISAIVIYGGVIFAAKEDGTVAVLGDDSEEWEGLGDVNDIVSLTIGDSGLYCLKQDGTLLVFPKGLQLYYEENYPEFLNESNIIGINGSEYGIIFLRDDGTVGGFNEDIGEIK